MRFVFFEAICKIFENSFDENLLSFYNLKGRIIALDVGTKRIGLAVSDDRKIIALPLKTINRDKYNKFLELLKIELSNYDSISLLVIGWPIKKNGMKSNICQAVKDFAYKIYNDLKLPILLFDERMSSVAIRDEMTRKNYKQKDVQIDHLSACLILSCAMQWLKSHDKLEIKP